LQALRAALAAAMVGRGQLALVSGEAGIGKSAIAAVIARDALAAQAVVTWGRAWEFADAPPYFPVWPCLKALGIELPQPGQGKHDEGHAFQLWEKVVAALAQATASAPVVWVLEDLHAADLGTLDLLTFLAQPLRALRILVLATVRADDPRLTERVAQRLTRMARDGVDVRLEPLPDTAIAALTEDILGRAVSKGAVRRLTDLTGGNPLFVVECARAFRSAGGVEGTLGSLPPTVRQVVTERVALLPEATRQALASAAVLGREFSAAAVARMNESLPARVIDTLLPALRTGVIKELSPGRFMFSHMLVQGAIDDALSAERRALLHGRADAALTVLGDSAEVLVERARHALSALPSGSAARALALVSRAAELLEHEGAFDRVFDLQVRLAEVRRNGLAPAASASDNLYAARVAHAAGRSQARRRLCEEVVVAARATGDAQLLANAALLHAADVRPSVVDRSQVALLEEARAALGEASSDLACRVLARLATALQPNADPALPISVGREAIRRARETGNDAVILEVLDVTAWALYFAPLPERRDHATELLERALAANDLPRALIAHEWLAFHHLEAGDFRAFQRDADSLLTLSDEAGHPRYRWRPLLLASARALALGHFAESERYSTEVSELGTLTDDPALPLALAMHDVMRLKLQRRDEEMLAAAAKLEHIMGGVWQATLHAAMFRAGCAARMENLEAAQSALSTIGARAASLDDPTIVALFAEACAFAGTDDERRRVRVVLARASSREVTGGHAAYIYDGTVARLLGLIDAALGDLTRAEQELSESRELAVARKQLPWVAQTSYELGSVLRRSGREDQARRLLEESAQIARDLGMAGLEQAAARNLESKLPAQAGGKFFDPPSTLIEHTGSGWSVRRGASHVYVKDSRGMQWLAKLVERPDEEIHVLTLACDEVSASVPESSAGEWLDERARRAYKERLAELERAIAEVESHGNADRAAALDREKQALVAELARAVGLGGRARHAGSATERARVNVQRRIKDAIFRIGELDQDLGRFFERSVGTGTFCCFRPR
jgi:tetratricopeptide (TPR) repeat protein